MRHGHLSSLAHARGCHCTVLVELAFSFASLSCGFQPPQQRQRHTTCTERTEDEPDEQETTEGPTVPFG